MTGTGTPASRVLKWLRDTWLIIGISAALLVLAELAYRLQAALRHPVDEAAVIPSDHPYAGQAWRVDWESGDAGWRTRFDPYRGLWGRPASRPYINIDSMGRRFTANPVPEAAANKVVLMLGGSAMWGYAARDSNTIPSLLAAELYRRGHRDIHVRNLAQSTFNATQEVATLLLELRSGRVPQVVIFMDGNNEVAPPYASGVVGSILNEARLARRMSNDAPNLATTIISQFQLIQRIHSALSTQVHAPPPGSSALCPEIARVYANLVEVTRALGAHYGFESFFFWQPMLATTRKQKTRWEKNVTTEQSWGDMVRSCTAAFDTLAGERKIPGYFPLHDIFDADTGSIFLDDYGHVTESANGVIARRIADRIDSLFPFPVQRR